MTSSKPYKALQNKAFHYGAYIARVSAGAGTWTTNGQIMVRWEVNDFKPLKDQQDHRHLPAVGVDGLYQPIDNALHAHHWSTVVAVSPYTINDIECVRLQLTGGQFICIKKVYLEYVDAVLNTSLDILVIDNKVVIVDMGVVRAIIAPMKELKEEK